MPPANTPHEGLSSRAVLGMFGHALELARDRGWETMIGFLNSLSNQVSENYKWLGMSPALREWVAERLAKGVRENGITIDNLHFEATLKFMNRDLRLDKTDQIRMRVADLAQRTADHWQILLSTLINTGETSLGYDGFNYFANNHVEGASGTQTNLLTNSDVAQLNVATATAPTESEMADAILGVIGHMYTLFDDVGEPINGPAKNFVVMVGVANIWGPTRAAVNKQNLSSGAGTVKPSPLDGADFTIDVVLNPRLTTVDDVFYVFRTDGPSGKPFIMQEEQGMQVKMLGVGSDFEFNNDAQLFGVDTWRNVGFGLWQHAMKATLS